MIVQSGAKFILDDLVKETRQKLLSGFFPLMGYPPTPLAENHSAKKTLSGNG